MMPSLDDVTAAQLCSHLRTEVKVRHRQLTMSTLFTRQSPFQQQQQKKQQNMFSNVKLVIIDLGLAPKTVDANF